ncbi:MAG: serine--tRNA ligase [Patescibacteria group bacterium]|nr:MAG: serine--tRNA ligase [Patescibacteria group bacterium]
MLDLDFIRKNSELVKQNTLNRNSQADIDELLRLDEDRRSLIATIEELRSTRNKVSRQHQKPSAEEIIEMKKVGEEIVELEKKLTDIEEALKKIWLSVPNLTHSEVLVSDDENNNPVLEQVGEMPKFFFEAKDHLELALNLDLLDLEKAAKVTGAKFYYLKKELAVLQLALVQYVMKMIIDKGYSALNGPDLIKTELLEALGFNPRGESSQVYHLEEHGLSLIGTSEVTLGAYHANEVLEQKALPLKYVSHSRCYRTEAGSYSKFSKGIFRVHQFDKVEMFVFCLPEDSEKIHNELLAIQKEIFNSLGLTYRIVDHCTADLGAPALRTFDLEAWFPGKPNTQGEIGDWGEVTSVSQCGDYQSRGLNIKYLQDNGEKALVHTLNGTGIAVTRAIAAIMEQFQTADGKVSIPEVLWPYTGFKSLE